jgi:hypothetical protein
MRFWVHDDLGPLRGFHTRVEAEAWMLPGMTLVVQPRPVKPKLDLDQFEEAPF